MKKRNFTNIIACLLLLLTASFSLDNLVTAAMQAEQGTTSKEDSMDTVYKSESPAIPLIDAAVPAAYQTASFGLGWFWGIESQFGIIKGVIRTRVGYAGGQAVSPTYSTIGDHTETVQVDYDPAILTYEQLLDIFWESHRPTGWNGSGQYMKAVFYHNEQQRDQAMASKSALEQELGSPVKTEIVPVRSFTMAEDYHQKFNLKRHDGLKNEMLRIYPHHQDFVNSTAVARLNGYVGKHGTKIQLAKEIERLGLSAEGQKVLTDMVRR